MAILQWGEKDPIRALGVGGDQTQTGSLRKSGDPGGSIAVKYVIYNIEKTQVWISSDSDIDLNSKPLEEWYWNPTSDKADILLHNGHTIQVRLGNPDNPRSEDQSLHVFLNGRDLDGEPDHHNTDTDTPLHWALENGQVYASKLLIDNGADVNAKDNDGDTPLHGACGFGHADVAKQLIHNEANVNARNNVGRTPLHWACFFGRVDAAKLLIHNEANVNAKDNDGSTPLHYASVVGHVDATKLLIHKEANVNAKDNDGDTPLHYACLYGHVDAAKLLIHNEANVNAKNNDGNTAHRLAMMEGHQELAILIVTEEMKLLGFSGPPQESMAKRAVKELAKGGAKAIAGELVKAALSGM
eukprot:CAMPEP_0201715124 /NCGR_PEP_ID=MMETSP0593-20130828/1378_1 /ASSEMBLY_ACC=CAM_ASM_000672 /TAXON_ID=267983 /ORGANISM="Skeletonema japonicum, Strain CCMP2506" /LENGTH=355 /DNA_ID=CAMNT_0048204537 /DNA_START=111 /DNA_END=1179 /DNA_ORIENTATION=-